MKSKNGGLLRMPALKGVSYSFGRLPIDTNLFPVIHKWLASLEPSDYEAVQPYAFYGRQIGLFTVSIQLLFRWSKI